MISLIFLISLVSNIGCTATKTKLSKEAVDEIINFAVVSYRLGCIDGAKVGMTASESDGRCMEMSKRYEAFIVNGLTVK